MGSINKEYITLIKSFIKLLAPNDYKSILDEETNIENLKEYIKYLKKKIPAEVFYYNAGLAWMSMFDIELEADRSNTLGIVALDYHRLLDVSVDIPKKQKKKKYYVVTVPCTDRNNIFITEAYNAKEARDRVYDEWFKNEIESVKKKGFIPIYKKDLEVRSLAKICKDESYGNESSCLDWLV